MTENEAREILTLSNEMKEKLPNLQEVYSFAVKWLEELEQYRSIGTVSECREAVEKKKEKKPIEEKGVYASGQSDYVCPSCGDSVIILDPECQAYELGYCASCGQRLDWSDNP